MSAPVVETHRLAKTYGLAPVLRQVDLRLLAGSGAFVVGGNGAGKSTLLRIIAGLEAPSDGRALVFGQDTRRLAAPHFAPVSTTSPPKSRRRTRAAHPSGGQV